MPAATPDQGVTRADPLDVDATALEPSSARTQSADDSADAGKSHPAQAVASSFEPHHDFDISIIWHNVYADSDFVCVRKESRGPIERILVDFAKVLESGVFEQVLSVNASKHLFCVTVACTKNNDDGIMDAILSVT